MEPEIQSRVYKSVDARISRRFPIKHLLIFEWEFDKAKSWEEVKEFLGKYFYWIDGDDGSIAFTTPVKPTVIGILRKNGELIVINMDKYYSISEVENMSKKYFGRNTGLKLKRKKIC